MTAQVPCVEVLLVLLRAFSREPQVCACASTLMLKDWNLLGFYPLASYKIAPRICPGLGYGAPPLTPALCCSPSLGATWPHCLWDASALALAGWWCWQRQLCHALTLLRGWIRAAACPRVLRLLQCHLRARSCFARTHTTVTRGSDIVGFRASVAAQCPGEFPVALSQEQIYRRLIHVRGSVKKTLL